MIDRNLFLQDIVQIHRIHSVCAILGPRQCGKTTLSNIYRQTMVQPCLYWSSKSVKCTDYLRGIDFQNAQG